MKKLIINILVFVIIIISIDVTLSNLLDMGRPLDYTAFIESKEEYDKLNSVDLLILGDSQTADGFIPSVFNAKLGGQAFNYGVYDLSPFEEYYLLKDLISRHSQFPKLVVLGMNILMFNYKVTGGRYTPLFIKSPSNLIPLLFKSENFGSFSLAGRKRYLFNPLIKRLLTGEISTKVRRDVRNIEYGYLQNVKHFSNESALDCNKGNTFFSRDFVEQQKVYFIKMILFLKEKNIPFILVNTPKHKTFLNCMKNRKTYSKYKSTLKEIQRTFNVKVFNEDHDLLLEDLNDKDFLSGDHLCYTGARKFSIFFAEHLASLGVKFD